MGIYHACDIRGIADTELTDDVARDIGRAIGVKLSGKKIVVGGDVRLSTPRLHQIMVEALTESGCAVVDIGTVATPVFYFAVKETGASGGVMITASHNPPAYNGFKLVQGATPVTDKDIADIAALVKRGARTCGAGSVTALPMIDQYIKSTAAKALRGRLRIVVDAGNGATAQIAPALYRSLGYDVVELFCEPDGTFPHRAPNPALAENLIALREKVVATGAVLGVAFDGDGDRAAFVDEKGRAVDNDDMIILIARSCLERQPGAIIYDSKCSMAVREEIEKAGGRAVMARAGHTFSKAAFLREHALFAGEISGHFFFEELGYDDGMYAGLKIAQFVAQHGPLSACIDAIPNYFLTPDIRVPYAGADKENILALAAEKLSLYRPNRIDGVRIDFEDGWGMIRASVTEPLFTLRFEAKTQPRLRAIAGRILQALPDDVQAAVKEKLPPL